MTQHGSLYLLSSFTTSAEGGNPAGVWIGDTLPHPQQMLRIAREVGFSETAFLAPAEGSSRTVRYYSPEAEVAFCGHATIAAGVQLGILSGEGTYQFDTAAGPVAVDVRTADGHAEASLTSVPPLHASVPDTLLEAVLETLGWMRGEMDMKIPPALAYAGAWHLVIAAARRERLVHLEYDFEGLKLLMINANLTTIQLVWREDDDVFHSRNPFPVGGVVEDPATGAAAAALGGYLRDAGLISAPTTILIRQGEVMGRPSRLIVDIPVEGGIMVKGNAVLLDSRQDREHPLGGKTL